MHRHSTMKQVLLVLALTAGVAQPAALAAHAPPRPPEASLRRPPPALPGGPNRTEPRSFAAQESLRRPPPALPGGPNRTEPRSFAAQASPRRPPLAAPRGPNRTQSETAQDGPPGAAGFGPGGAGPRSPALLLQERAAIPTPYPMDTVEHQKRPGGVYAEGSPLYRKQRAMHSEAEAADGPAAPVEELAVPAEEAPPLAPADHMPDALRQAGDAWGAPQAWQEPRRVFAALPLWQEALAWVSVHLVFVVLVCIAAWLYRSYGKPQYQRNAMPSQGDAFAYPLFAVTGIGMDWPICLMAFCCPAIRWADTMSMAPLLPFWAALGLMLLLACLQPATGGLISILTVLVAVYFRQRLRRIYNHGPFTPKNMALDCLTWTFCCCCAIVQEAREVEHVQKQRFPPSGGAQARSAAPPGGGFMPQPVMAHMTAPGSRYMPPASGPPAPAGGGLLPGGAGLGYGGPNSGGPQTLPPDGGFAMPGPGMPLKPRDG